MLSNNSEQKISLNFNNKPNGKLSICLLNIKGSIKEVHLYREIFNRFSNNCTDYFLRQIIVRMSGDPILFANRIQCFEIEPLKKGFVILGV